MIGEKVKSLYGNLKQNEDEGSKAGEFNACKGLLDIWFFCLFNNLD